MSVISAPNAGCSDDGLLSRECRRRSIPEAGERASGQVAATALDGDQERRERLPVLGKGAVLAHRLACLLAVESDEWEQPLQSDAGRRSAAALASCDLTRSAHASLQQRQHGARERGRALGVAPWAVGGAQSGVQIERN